MTPQVWAGKVPPSVQAVTVVEPEVSAGAVERVDQVVGLPGGVVAEAAVVGADHEAAVVAGDVWVGEAGVVVLPPKRSYQKLVVFAIGPAWSVTMNVSFVAGLTTFPLGGWWPRRTRPYRAGLEAHPGRRPRCDQ